MRHAKHRKKPEPAIDFGDGKIKRRMTVLSVIMTVVFLLSATMTSFAWYDFDQTKTSVFRGTVDNVTVILQKVEKDADGVIRADPVLPVKNAEFRLYAIDPDGTETPIPGGPWYTDAAGRITFDGRDSVHPKLGIGKYCFTETSPAFGYTYDKDESGNDITRYEFEITHDDALTDSTVTVPAYNRRTGGTLAIKKTVEGDAPDDAFEFTVTFSDNGTYTYSIDGGSAQSVPSGGTLTLKHGQTALFTDIPMGVQYRVTETPHPDYTVSGSGHQGSVTESGSTAAFVNTYHPAQLGSITVTKEVSGEGADLNKEFTFTAVIGGEEETFTLRSGEKKIFADLSPGTEYTVTESDYTADGYTSTVSEYTGTVTQETLLPFTNIYTAASDNPFGNLTVTKEVIGENADPNKSFTFEAVFTGEGAPDSPQIFTLKGGESKTFTDIPAGTAYTVRETDPAGYQPELRIVTGIIAGDGNASVIFRNRAPESSAKLKITKILAGEYPKADEDKEFIFNLIIDGEKLDFTLKPNETKEFEVPYGVRYEVIEADYFADGYVQSVENGIGTVAEETVEAVVTNTFVGEPMIEIEGEKKWDLNGHTDITLPDSITVRLKNGELIVTEKAVKPDENGNWKYTFTVPKYSPDGKEIGYTVEELPIPSFRPTYSGYDITNTYIAPIETDIPPVIKSVQGENVPETEFSFVLKGQNSAPMPRDSVGDAKTVSLTGGGEAHFGSIIFTEVGTYTYTVSESDNGAAGWTYDSARYTLTFTVTETDGKLSASASIEQNGETAEKLQFTNSYSEPQEDTVTVQGQKIWDHGTNSIENYPDSIVVYVYADGDLTSESRITEQDNWRYSFQLPRFAQDGHEIIYTIDEADVPDYEKKIDGYDITNTYVGTSHVTDTDVTTDTGDTTDTDEPPRSDDPPQTSGPLQSDPPTGSDDVPTGSDDPPYSGGASQTGEDPYLRFWFIMMIVSGTMVMLLTVMRATYPRGKHDR